MNIDISNAHCGSGFSRSHVCLRVGDKQNSVDFFAEQSIFLGRLPFLLTPLLPASMAIETGSSRVRAVRDSVNDAPLCCPCRSGRYFIETVSEAKRLYWLLKIKHRSKRIQSGNQSGAVESARELRSAATRNCCSDGDF